jgi:hypothetical protein
LVEAIFLIELEFLHGRQKLDPTPVTSFLKYKENDEARMTDDEGSPSAQTAES